MVKIKSLCNMIELSIIGCMFINIINTSAGVLFFTLSSISRSILCTVCLFCAQFTQIFRRRTGWVQFIIVSLIFQMNLIELFFTKSCPIVCFVQPQSEAFVEITDVLSVRIQLHNKSLRKIVVMKSARLFMYFPFTPLGALL